MKKVIPTFLVALAIAGCVVFIANQQAQQGTAASQASSSQSSDRQFIYGGLPKGQPVTLLKNRGYWVGYSEKHKDPLWVSYRLFKVENPPKLPRPKGKFLTDDRTEAKVTHNDYTSTGYDRGHMAPNRAIAVCYGEDGQKETFLMSNICPQKPDLNRKCWERLETKEINDYARRFEQVWVIDGPIFNDTPATIGPGIDVPVAFYKIIVDEEHGQPRMLAFIMPQTVKGTEPVDSFLTSVREVEKETGLDFFSELDKAVQDKLETAAPKELW